jgi:NADPH-dependent F420 reductase
MTVESAGSDVRAATNEEAAASSIVVMATPWDSAPAVARDLADLLADKVVISMANALVKVGKSIEPVNVARGSAAQALQAAIPRSYVVGALHHVPAKELGEVTHALEADILICGDHPAAKLAVADLLRGIEGARVFDAGSLSSAGAIEAMTAVLVNLNIRYRTRSAIRITGIEDQPL